MLVQVERNELGPRVWIGRKRWHHYHSGAALILIGVRLVWTDRRDLKGASRGPVRAGDDSRADTPHAEHPRRKEP